MRFADLLRYQLRNTFTQIKQLQYIHKDKTSVDGKCVVIYSEDIQLAQFKHFKPVLMKFTFLITMKIVDDFDFCILIDVPNGNCLSYKIVVYLFFIKTVMFRKMHDG